MYKLSNLAAKDFEQIFEYSLINCGVEQAKIYTNSRHKTLLMIEEQPLIGYECKQITQGLRCHDHQKHAIYYQIKPDNIFIVRILHQQNEV